MTEKERELLLWMATRMTWDVADGSDDLYQLIEAVEAEKREPEEATS